MMKTAYYWQPIQDLPDTWPELVSLELKGLAAVWQDQLGRLHETEMLKQFNQRLQREWAIETGIIEGLYSIDRGVTQTLIELGIEASLIPHGATDKPVEQVVAILKDHQETIEGLFDFITQRRELSAFYIKEIHQLLTRHQQTVMAASTQGHLIEVPLIRGDWEKLPNNPKRPDGQIHEYCPPEQVASEIDRLIAMHKQHLSQKVSPEVEAAWLHHRFTQIHPFQDGNGRVIRTLASLIFLQAGWFPLIIDRDQRVLYISALEMADAGNLQPLVELFVKNQKKAFLGALSISQDLLKKRKPLLQEIMSAAAESLKTKAKPQQQVMFKLTEKLEKRTIDELRKVASELTDYLQQVKVDYRAKVDHSHSPRRRTWYIGRAKKIAEQLNYYADTRTYHGWVRLQIYEERQTNLVILYHSFSRDFAGIMVASAMLEYLEKDADRELSVDGPYPVGDEIFQFSYQEEESVVFDRFDKWLNEILLLGLNQWREQL